MNTSIVAAVGLRLQHAASLLLIATGLLACGGGEDTLKQSADGDLRKTALSASSEELPQALAVVALEKISEVRIGRTIFDYTFRVSIRNDGQARGDVAAQILGAGAGTTILDGQATLLVIEAGKTTAAADTITLRHNRLYPFNPGALTWSITSTRAVVISGFVIDDPVANATVEVTSLSSLSVVAKATTDQNGQYTTPSLPQSLLVSGYSAVAKGGTINGEPFVGALRAVYGLPSDFEQSHLTFLTTAAAIAAESTGVKPAQLAVTVEQIGNDAAARGIFPENWKNLDVANQFSTANSTIVALDGPVRFSDALALLLKGPAPSADGSTSCGLGEIAGEWECRARIGPNGGRIYSQSGVGTGDVLAYFPPMTTSALLGRAAVEVVVTRSEGGNVLKFSVSTARDLVVKTFTTSLLRDGTLFESPPQYTLPAPDFITSLNVEDACASPDHVDMPSSDCLTRVSGIKPGIFVLDGRVYLGKKNYHRVPNGNSYTHATTAMDGGIHRRFGATLKASANRSNLRHPVLFVHGFVARTDEVGTFGGGDDTWGLFPQYVGELVDPNGVLPQLFDRYNYQWRSNASFYTAASDFADAVRYISAQHGGKRVHVIAHSFGGVLVRTALQNLTGRDADIGGMIQSVTTLGTPHSGIRDPGLWADATVPGRPGVILPDGWDASILEYLCGQLSCYEAGLRANIPDWIIEAHQPKPEEPVILGGLIADLHLRTDALQPHQRLLLLMGVGFNRTTIGAFTSGDNLITLAGQRFSPADPECSADHPLRFATAAGGGALVSERLLGLTPGTCANAGRLINFATITPYVTARGLAGDDDAYYGYSHTIGTNSGAGPTGQRPIIGQLVEAREAEIPLSCGGSIACTHDSWVSTKALLLSFHGGPPSPDFAAPMSVRSASCTAPVVGVAMVCTVAGSGLPENTNFRATNCSPSPMTALSGGSESQRQFGCTPLSEGVPVAVSYEVPGFIGPLPPVPTVVAAAFPVEIATSLYDSFDDVPVSPTRWQVNPGLGGFSLSNGTVTFGRAATASTKERVHFSGGKIVVEARLVGNGPRGRDTNIALFDVASGDSIFAGDTNYWGWGLYALGNGAYNLTPPNESRGAPTGGINLATNGVTFAVYKVIRLTVEGTTLTVERGDSLDALTERMVRTLGSSVAGRTFYLQIGTGGGTEYSPGTFDWVSVRTTSSGLALNDTGITANQCYAADSNALVSCTSAAAIALNDKQDGMVGRDVTHNDDSDGKAGISFGLVPKAGGGFYDKTECVKDKVTGLMWEGKTSDGGPRDGGQTYSNYGDGRAGDANAYVITVNSAGLCGQGGWRLPSVRELQGIVDYGVARPAVDPGWFLNTGAGSYWSSSLLAGFPEYAWFVSFYSGDVAYFYRDQLRLFVRLVR